MSDSTQTRDLTLTAANSSCACCAPGHERSETTSTTEAVSSDFLVSGMTCGHCVASVTEELSSLDGVDEVNVELNAGGTSKVTVASAAPLDIQKVRAAVAEAGYDLVDAGR
jgi:copper chaperone